MTELNPRVPRLRTFWSRTGCPTTSAVSAHQSRPKLVQRANQRDVLRRLCVRFAHRSALERNGFV